MPFICTFANIYVIIFLSYFIYLLEVIFMSTKTNDLKDNKAYVRLSSKLNSQLEERAKELGISKSALIINYCVTGLQNDNNQKMLIDKIINNLTPESIQQLLKVDDNLSE